ncbi:hypothetical protein ACFSX9_15550 [Flavobacterium ardleyense]|uniref:Uncharacterized protein n=1 Tax=Flavobacterium ardleyense TaxID=2038737 RepID=A0ABW5ZD22_9FLAO
MAGEGSMLHAIKSLAYNKSLRNKFDRSSWKDYKNSNSEPLIDHKKASPELLAEIRTRLQAENKKSKKQLLIFIALVFFCFLILYFYIN